MIQTQKNTTLSPAELWAESTKIERLEKSIEILKKKLEELKTKKANQ